jgi:DNA-directed RNA polymerase III subunit RPC2
MFTIFPSVTALFSCPPSRGCALLFLNGNILGVHRRPKRFVRALRELRRRGRLGEFVSVYLQHDSVQVGLCARVCVCV